MRVNFTTNATEALKLKRKSTMRNGQSEKSSIRLSKKGVFVRTSKGERRIGAALRVTAYVDRDAVDARDGPAAHVELRFTDRSGKKRKTLVKSGMIASGRKLIEFLADAGYVVPETSFHKALKQALAAAHPKRLKRAVRAPGWCRRVYVINSNERIARRQSDARDLMLWPEPRVKLGPCNNRGTLKRWQKQIAAVGRCSSRARLLLGASFAAIVLRLVGHPSFAINLVGPSSTAKTFLLKLAASVQGNVDEGSIPTLDATPTALEEFFLGYRDSFLPLDEIGHLAGTNKEIAAQLKSLAFRHATGRAKSRAGHYEQSTGLPNLNSHSIIGMTTESSIAEINKGAGGQRLTGEAVRLIELPACHGEARDVFDKARATRKLGKPGSERREAIERLAVLLNDVQGTAARAFLRRLVRDKGAKRKLQTYLADFMKKVETRLSTPVDGRIAGSFAVIAAASRLAIEYGVLKWNYRSAERDIRRCLYDALAFSGAANSSPSEQSDSELLGDFERSLGSLKLLDLDGKKKSQSSAADVGQVDGFLKTFRGEKNARVLLKSSWLKAQYPNKRMRGRLLKLCISAGIMPAHGRAQDTNTFQETVGGKPIEVYRVHPKCPGAGSSTVTPQLETSAADANPATDGKWRGLHRDGAAALQERRRLPGRMPSSRATKLRAGKW
jgi:hypothetical protein